jgi:adenine phosphoribosyltransferase
MNVLQPEDLKRAIRNIPDFPKAGIQFKDITPVLAEPRLFAACIDLLCGPWRPGQVDVVVGIDARGFILGGAVAYKLQAAFVPVRKKGKLPSATLEQSYNLEYGSNTIAIHRDAFQPGQRVLLIDDLLATGGTAGAAIQMIQKLGVSLIEVVFFVELAFLGGRKLLDGAPVRSIVSF